MRVLVTWGSKHGGTEGIAHILGDALRQRGFDVATAPVDEVTKLDSYQAVIIGGALYANLWPANVRRFIHRHTAELRGVPVWFFSSGPLDDSAEHEAIPPTSQVSVLAERIGAKGHITFGGRLERDVKGFPASAMAEKRSGDWRNPERIRAWAATLADELPRATPGRPVTHRAGSVARLLAHGVVGGALCASVMLGLLQVMSLTGARIVHVFAAPLIFTAIAWLYFRPRGAREPRQVALVWTVCVALLELLIVGGPTQGGLRMFASILGTWVPYVLIFFATWGTGAMMSMMPFPKGEPRQGHA
ncbi:flavodoxin domain-containing protein [Hyalangium gracile]|uniref:flavodoxin domain-containing protein n=1 Tax=Hyalangium gracile TaxID=394092 RepID=UPI001CCABF41|nr:flavodoxin domain-containing protein [Hyalangium gracile]